MAKKKAQPMTVQEMATLGGRARAKQLTKERRAEIAKTAADTRWSAQKAAPVVRSKRAKRKQKGEV